MKNRNITWTLSLVCAILAGCDKNASENPYGSASGATKSPNFVQLYTIVDRITKLDKSEDSKYDFVTIHFTGTPICFMGCPDKEKEEFQKLAHLYNDISYNKTIVPGTNKVLSSPLTSINLTCNRDFDAAHGVGKPLDDIVMLYGTSPYNFIQRGYKSIPKPADTPDGPNWTSMYYGYESMMMPVNQVNTNNSKMLNPICNLYFTKKPTVAGEYTFTLTVRVGGNEIKQDFNYTF